jgi:hypothetical protein
MNKIEIVTSVSFSFHRSNGIFLSLFHSKTNQMHQFLKFILFWNDIPHVSDGISVRHQEFKTVHTATGICHTGSVRGIS